MNPKTLDLIIRHRPYFEAVAAAHTEAAKRENLSSQVIRAVSGAGAEPIRSVLAGMMTLETLHGPVARAREEMIYAGATEYCIATGRTAYGYGSSFVKGTPDPMLAGCERTLFEYDTMAGEFEWIGRIPTSIKAGRIGTRIYPNAAYYTAILAELIDWPAGLEFLLVAFLRAGAWAELLKK